MRLGSALLAGIRRQYKLTPCGWEQSAKGHHIRMGSGGSLCRFFARAFLRGNFPDISHVYEAENSTPTQPLTLTGSGPETRLRRV